MSTQPDLFGDTNTTATPCPTCGTPTRTVLSPTRGHLVLDHQPAPDDTPTQHTYWTNDDGLPTRHRIHNTHCRGARA